MAEDIKISVVIPSFNQGQFIEETLRSVLNQKGGDFEILVIDGGSTDETLDILNCYKRDIAYWVSEADRGQTHAINKGLHRISGDVWVVLNSDDLLAPDAFTTVAGRFQDSSTMWVGGLCGNFGANSIGGVRPEPVLTAKDYLSPWGRHSQYVFPFSGASYMRREVIERIGMFDESFHYSMDIEYYCRAIFEGGFRLTLVPDVLARWRWHPGSKTMRQGIAYAFRADEVRIAQRYAEFLPDDQRRQVEIETQAQLRALPSREAMWLLGEGHRGKALSLLAWAGLRNWSVAISRPWLGAVRRVLGFGA